MPITPEGLVRKMAETAKVVHGASEASVRAGTKLVRDEALLALTAVGVHNFRLRGVGKSGARLGATIQTFGSGSGFTGAVHASGPWQFIERDVHRHTLGSRIADRGDQVRMRVPGSDSGWRTGPFEGGGSTGKHPWRLGTEHARPKVAKLYEKEVFGAIRRTF